MRKILIIALSLLVMVASKGGQVPTWHHFTQQFDSSRGNQGEVNLGNIPLQKVTTADIRKAYAFSEMEYAPENVFTAQDIGLQEGETTAIGMANANALRALATDSALMACKVLKLDKMYYVQLPTWFSKGNSYNTSSICLPRDMRIDGEDADGNATGGFITDQLLFYTEHSLELNKVRVVVRKDARLYTFFVNCTRGIDHVSVKGCVFSQGEDAQKRGKRFRFYVMDQSPFEKGTTLLRSDNSIGHILFEGNTNQGKEFTYSDQLCVLKSWRMLDNTLTDIAGVGISHGTNNDKKHASMMAYVSCPLYIAGNKFFGRHEVYKVHRKWADYYCAALVENSRVYMLRNTIKDFVCARAIVAGEPKCPGTYDLYFNGQQSYFVNNHVTNLLNLSYYRQSFGTLKGKGGSTPLAFKDRHVDIVRHYAYNTYDINRSEVEKMWKDRTYPDDGADARQERQLDGKIVLDDVLTLNFQPFVDALERPAVDLLHFCHNTIKYPNIGGMESSSYWPCRRFVCTDNVFESRRISSGEYSSRYHPLSHKRTDEYLFIVHHATDVRIHNNVFSAKNAAIRMLLYRYCSRLKQSARPKNVSIQGNKCPPTSKVTTKRLDTTPWKFSDL